MPSNDDTPPIAAPGSRSGTTAADVAAMTTSSGPIELTDEEAARYMALPYTYTVVPDLDVGGFVIRVNEVPGCMSQGETIREAVARVREAMDLWIGGKIEDGLPVPKPASEGPGTYYDLTTDILYIQVRPLNLGETCTTQKVAPGVMMDLDAAGNPVGLEILGAAQRYPATALAAFPIQSDPVQPFPPTRAIGT